MDRGSVWDIEPDPPTPFHPGDLVEHTLQVLTADPAGHLADLRAMVTDLLAPIGRGQVLDPILITDPAVVDAARDKARHRLPPPPPDTKLWQFCLGIRGEGDHTQLGDQLVRAHHDARLHFEALFSRYYTTGTTEHAHALNKYPELHDSTDGENNAPNAPATGTELPAPRQRPD